MNGARNYDYLFKILLVGESGVGKSALLRRFSEDQFSDTYTSTVGVDFTIKNETLPNSKIVKLQIWDTAGQERFQTITPIYYRGANAIIIVYDVTDRVSFNAVQKWSVEVSRFADPNALVILVGNKADLKKRVVETHEGQYLADSMKMGIFIETSAKSGEYVNTVFGSIRDHLVKNFKAPNYETVKPERIFVIPAKTENKECLQCILF